MKKLYSAASQGAIGRSCADYALGFRPKVRVCFLGSREEEEKGNASETEKKNVLEGRGEGSCGMKSNRTFCFIYTKSSSATLKRQYKMSLGGGPGKEGGAICHTGF